MANNDPDVDKFVRAVEDATTFPMMTEPFSSRTGSPLPGRSTAGLTVNKDLVSTALHEVLSWRPSTTDVKGLKEALTHSFDAQEEQGRKVYTHVPRSYIMQVQSDGGAVTGAQASIFARAKAAVDQCLPLLEGLYPLHSDSDREDLAAARATIRLALTGLVEELGRKGGPRVQRVDTLFELLLGKEILAHPPQQFDADEVDGQLGLLRDRLGLEGVRVNRAEEEKNLTNFLILADHVFTLWLSWTSLRTYFDRIGREVFLGPQLVLLSRSLRVVSESVHEAYTILDSVFVGPAEREVIPLRFQNGESPLTIAELLEWVDSFASQEGPRLIQEAGKDGVIALRSTVDRLSGLMHEAVAITQQRAQNPTRGVHTARVSTALEAVVFHIDAVRDLASPLSRLAEPKVKAVDPVSVPAFDGQFPVRIEGKGFQPDSAVELTRPLAAGQEQVVKASRVHFASATTLWATFPLTSALVNTLWTVVVRNSDGVESELTNAFTIGARQISAGLPQIRRLDPSVVPQGSQGFPLNLEGTGFQVDAEVEIAGDGITISAADLASDALLELVLDVENDATPGPRNVTVTNPDGQFATLPNALLIVKAEVEEPLALESVKPGSGMRGESVPVQILGNGFTDETDVSFGPHIKVEDLALFSETELSATLVLSRSTATGLHAITVSDSQGSVSLPDVFLVLEAQDDLLITALEPSSGTQGDTVEIAVKGTGFTADTVVDFGEGIDVQGPLFSSSTELIVMIVIADSAEPGPRTITASNSQGSADILDAFEVLEEVDELTITAVAPDSASQGETVDVTIGGTGFTNDTLPDFGADTDVRDFEVVSDTELSVTIAVAADAVPGLRTITVSNSQGSAELPDAFELLEEVDEMEIESVDPSSGVQGEVLTVTLTGSGLGDVVSVDFGEGIHPELLSTEELTVEITIDTGADTSLRTVTVTDSQGNQAELADGFEVVAN
jgi:Quinohemoprotein amine dehydrogenase, alpha subunit domain III